MWEVAALVTGALLIGIAKTSVGGFGVVAVMLFALVLPTKESTAAVLLLLIVGDVVAVTRYRRHADWALLRHLLPYVLPGIALGAVLLHFSDDVLLRRFIGAILAVFVGLQLVLRARGQLGPRRDSATAGPHPLAAAGYGTAAGFTTMTANAAGPVMTLYLLAAGVNKTAFVGTGAWYFLIVNLTKVPFSAALGLFPQSTLVMDLALVPVVLLGTVVGVWLTNRLSQKMFEQLALVASVLAAIVLLVK